MGPEDFAEQREALNQIIEVLTAISEAFPMSAVEIAIGISGLQNALRELNRQEMAYNDRVLQQAREYQASGGIQLVPN